MLEVRCSGCQRRIGWATSAPRTSVWCAQWCAREPAVLYNSDERQIQLWEALSLAGVSMTTLARNAGVTRQRVDAAVRKRRAELTTSA